MNTEDISMTASTVTSAYSQALRTNICKVMLTYTLLRCYFYKLDRYVVSVLAFLCGTQCNLRLYMVVA